MTKILWLAVLICLASASWADPSPRPKVRTLFDFRQELNLSDDQISAMKAQLGELSASVKASKEELVKLENDYRALLVDEKTTVAQARAKLDQIAATTTNMRLKDLEISRKITAIMTVEQRQKWKAVQVREKAKKAN